MLKILEGYDIKNIKGLGFHHFGGLRDDRYYSTQNLTEEHIRQAHKLRGFRDIGYTAIIWPDELTQYRLVGDETAAIKGKNFDYIYVAPAGNFTRKPDGTLVDTLTPFQLDTAQNLEIWAYENGIPLRMIGFPHRRFSNTECFGNGLPDDYFSNLLIPYFDNIIRTLQLKVISLLQILLNKLKAPMLGGDDSCQLLLTQEDINGSH